RAVAFDSAHVKITGTPANVLANVLTKEEGASEYALAADGSLFYVAGPASGFGEVQRTLAWVDRAGHETPIAAPPRLYVAARVSPDGSRFALDVRGDDGGIWMWDEQRRNLVRLGGERNLFPFGGGFSPFWTRDGARIVFSATDRGGLIRPFWRS